MPSPRRIRRLRYFSDLAVLRVLRVTRRFWPPEAIRSLARYGQSQQKAAEGSRTPRRLALSNDYRNTDRSWSAAALCGYRLRKIARCSKSRPRRLPFVTETLLLATLFLGSTPLVGYTADAARTFQVKGTIEEVQAENKRIVVRHEAISNYMDAMTMPFKVREVKELSALQKGDVISFRLHVSDSESWIDEVTKVRTGAVGGTLGAGKSDPTAPPEVRPGHPLMDYKFTNELGQAVSLSDFRGQALAITFFFTRCPIPDYCPRLSKNFEMASEKLHAIPGGPTNWHFLSVTFDPEHDSPRALKAYGELYHYDPAHWSFLTGPSNRIAALAQQSNLKYERDGAFFNHDFRTLIVDANGHLQMVFPMGGDLSDAIVQEIQKAMKPKTTGPAETKFHEDSR